MNRSYRAPDPHDTLPRGRRDSMGFITPVPLWTFHVPGSLRSGLTQSPFSGPNRAALAALEFGGMITKKQPFCQKTSLRPDLRYHKATASLISQPKGNINAGRSLAAGVVRFNLSTLQSPAKRSCMILYEFDFLDWPAPRSFQSRFLLDRSRPSIDV